MSTGWTQRRRIRDQDEECAHIDHTEARDRRASHTRCPEVCRDLRWWDQRSSRPSTSQGCNAGPSQGSGTRTGSRARTSWTGAGPWTAGAGHPGRESPSKWTWTPWRGSASEASQLCGCKDEPPKERTQPKSDYSSRPSTTQGDETRCPRTETRNKWEFMSHFYRKRVGGIRSIDFHAISLSLSLSLNYAISL